MIALIETKPTSTNFDKYFEFEFERFALCSDSSKAKILKKDVDLDIDADAYEWIILVGAEPFKHFTREEFCNRQTFIMVRLLMKSF